MRHVVAKDHKPSGEQERHNADGHNNGVKILQFLFGLQLPLTRKLWVTLSNVTNKVRGTYIYKEVFLRLYYCVVMMLHVCRDESADDNTTQAYISKIETCKLVVGAESLQLHKRIVYIRNNIPKLYAYFLPFYQWSQMVCPSFIGRSGTTRPPYFTAYL